MPYLIRLEVFNNQELRLVRVPAASGRKKVRDEDEDQLQSLSTTAGTSAPQYGAGGSDPSSSGSENLLLVSSQEFVKRSHSDLAERKYGRAARESLRRIGRTAEVFDEVPGHWQFVTVTFPTESIEGQTAIAKNTPWIVQQVKNYVRKFARGPETYFYCWEKQKRGTLHLHYCAHLPTAHADGFRTKALKLWFSDVLVRFRRKFGINVGVGRYGVDWSDKPHFLRVETQAVEKSIGRYLAKYVSKGASKNSESDTLCPSPRRWTGASVNLKDLMKSLTRKESVIETGFVSAKSRFDGLMAKLRLMHPSAKVFYNSLTDCDGETLSMFKVYPCQRFKRFTIMSRVKLVRSIKDRKAELLVRLSVLPSPPRPVPLTMIGSRSRKQQLKALTDYFGLWREAVCRHSLVQSSLPVMRSELTALMVSWKSDFLRLAFCLSWEERLKTSKLIEDCCTILSILYEHADQAGEIVSFYHWIASPPEPSEETSESTQIAFF